MLVWLQSMDPYKLYRYFQACFKRINRSERERLLCAMIRVNYATPWEGDLRLLQSFFPSWYHARLVEGGFTSLIEALSPFSDDPTESGVIEVFQPHTETEVTVKVSEVTREIF